MVAATVTNNRPSEQEKHKTFDVFSGWPRSHEEMS